MTAPTPDEQLMTALHRDHYAVLLAFASRYTGSREQAEDAVQETLLRAWQRIDRLEGASVRSYLFTVVRNVLTDTWRAQQARPRLVHDEVALRSATSGDDIELALESQLVATALGRLTEDHRAVVRLLYYEGLSVAEAAARLTVPEGTVKSRAYYAVRALRAAFEEMGVLQ
ncbi:sigma-70 family RNA polymerase sigma factor [Streptomyces sp. P6-2-1]|uniref:sigma-70 family RNA polymerase sigma factor n=1 Tax=unclassified Streptomyces TaxID=2593676 RepID=UPI003D3680EF